MSETFELRPYLSFPVQTPAAFLALARAMISAYNARQAVALQKRVAWVHKHAVDLRALLGGSQSAPTSTSRQCNRDLDRVWAIVARRLDDCIEFAPEQPDQAAQAKQLKAWLLGEGLAWLNARYRPQWALSEAKIGALDAQDASDRLATLEQLVGAHVVAILRSRHAAFGAVLGITEPAPVAEAPRIREAVTALRSALINYVQGIGGLVDAFEPATLDHAQALLAPIDAFRAALDKPTGNDAGEAGETTEAPEVPIPEPV